MTVLKVFTYIILFMINAFAYFEDLSFHAMFALFLMVSFFVEMRTSNV